MPSRVCQELVVVIVLAAVPPAYGSAPSEDDPQSLCRWLGGITTIVYCVPETTEAGVLKVVVTQSNEVVEVNVGLARIVDVGRPLDVVRISSVQPDESWRGRRATLVRSPLMPAVKVCATERTARR